MNRPIPITIYPAEMAKLLPVPTMKMGDGYCTLEDIPRLGKGSLIWRRYPSGSLYLDYEAMTARDRAVDLHLN